MEPKNRDKRFEYTYETIDCCGDKIQLTVSCPNKESAEEDLMDLAEMEGITIINKSWR